jgi:hypothetical protein
MKINYKREGKVRGKFVFEETSINVFQGNQAMIVHHASEVFVW